MTVQTKVGPSARGEQRAGAWPMDENEYFSLRVARDYLPQVGVALWVFDIDAARVVWANAAGREVWSAASMEELRTRDLAADMSPVVRRRLAQYQEDFARQAAEFRESWTIYPKGVPRTLDVVFRGMRLPDGRMGMFCEAPEMVRSTPEALRSAEAVLHTSVCISLISFDGAVLYANTAARACYGGALACVWQRFAQEADYDRLLAEVEVRGVYSEAVQVLTLHGRRWHHVQASRCFDAVTGKRAILISENDVTEAHEARQVLLSSRNAALEASRQKTAFVANMSHEIRTPLNGVLGLAQLLARTDLSPEQRELVETLRTSGEALMAIIQDNLDISRIEAGIFDLTETVFSVASLLSDAAGTLYSTAVDRGVGISVDSAVAPDHRFRADAKRIRQVLINLLGNAVKFSNGTPVTLGARERQDGHLEFFVADRGPGIAKADRERIFERFNSAGRAMRHQHGGNGLGLSIAKSLIERMGGAIWVESEPGKGATFRFHVPVVRQASAPPPQPAAPTRSASLQGLRVLLAEDNETNRFIVRRLCEQCGVEIRIARNGLEALEALQRECFDVVLMDVHMPVLSGAEAIRRIRASGERFRDVPVIVLSADVREVAMCELRALGADEYVAKPIDADALLAQISRLAGQATVLCRDMASAQDG